MYASLGIRKNPKHSGELIGTHRKIDKTSRRMLSKYLDNARIFPSAEQILQFEGINGPDGLKRKSPGVDEPMHFINPQDDDGVLIGLIDNHHNNLVKALASRNIERAAFEAAWMAHAITDGLTPAHHYPYQERVKELMKGKDYKQLFGIKIKGIMRGDNLTEALRNNWLYWGTNGIMTKHVAFEYGVANLVAVIPQKNLMLGMSRKNFDNIDYKKVFYRALGRVDSLKMYDRFLEKGWTTELMSDTYNILISEIIKTVALCWASCINEAEEIMRNEKK